MKIADVLPYFGCDQLQMGIILLPGAAARQSMVSSKNVTLSEVSTAIVIASKAKQSVLKIAVNERYHKKPIKFHQPRCHCE